MFTNKKNKYMTGNISAKFEKALDILNYVPADFRQTKRWADFSDPVKFENVYSRKIAALSVDSMCGAMFDGDIISEGVLMQNSADQQLIQYCGVVEHYRGIINGGLNKLMRLLDNLESDLDELNNEITEYEQLAVSLKA